MLECEKWFDKVFLKYLEASILKEEVKVLIMNNPSSHFKLHHDGAVPRNNN
jgi:hypothetical protein